MERDADISFEKFADWHQPNFDAIRDYAAYEDIVIRNDDAIMDVVNEWKEKKGTLDPVQSWRLIPAARLIKIWNDYVKLGFVRDDKGMEMIAEIATENVAKITANTILCGHTESRPEGVVADMFEIAEGEADALLDGIWDFAWNISDYGLKPLNDYVFLLSKTKSSEEKLLIVDHILNVTHARSDLASWFVEGGSKTLSILAGDPCGRLYSKFESLYRDGKDLEEISLLYPNTYEGYSEFVKDRSLLMRQGCYRRAA
ncbi:MAG: hypothetical protein ACLP29_06220 [Dissulfurispiraceae bacterium]